MRAKRIEKIPIAQIRVLSPRARNAVTFRGIVGNIQSVGLKKPITLFRRQPAADGTQYDLVCGQGRLEAIGALGGKNIPAILTDAPLKDRYLMSLVENVARKRPPLSNLLLEVRSLKKRGYKNSVIALKLGMGHTYVDGIVRLLHDGEDRLVEQVEAGTVPLSIAIKIATAGREELQRALSEAYEEGHLRGAKLAAVQRLIARRSAKSRKRSEFPLPQNTTGQSLAREYERHTQKQRAMLHRAATVGERLALLCGALKQLLSDQVFVQLLRSAGLDTIPSQLASRVQ